MEIPFDSLRKGSIAIQPLDDSDVRMDKMSNEYQAGLDCSCRRCRRRGPGHPRSRPTAGGVPAGDGAARKRRGEVVVLYAVGPMRVWDGNSSRTRADVCHSADIPQ